jgi:hypothetical protein
LRPPAISGVTTHCDRECALDIEWQRIADPGAALRSVLASPLSLEIRGEHVTGADEGFLDNFELHRPE